MRKLIYVVIGVAVVIVVFFFKVRYDAECETVLKFVDKYCIDCPVKMGSDLRLDSAIADGRDLKYYLTVFEIDKDSLDTDKFAHLFEGALTSNKERDENYVFYEEYVGAITYYCFFSDGSELCEFKIRY